MRKELEVQHEVQSSNLKSIGLYKGMYDKKEVLVIRVDFQRGASYDYYPCTEKEFQEAFVPGVIIKDWFNSLKLNRNFKRLL